MTIIQAFPESVANDKDIVDLPVSHPSSVDVPKEEVSIDRSIDARERILTVATSMFSSNGYDGVSTTQIAKASGVTQPLIHYHFKSKFSLWKACVSQAFDWLENEFIKSVKSSMTENSALNVEIMIKKFVVFAAMRPEFSRFLLSEGSQDSDRLTWMVTEHVQPLAKELEAVYSVGVEAGLLRKMPVPQLLSIVLGAATQFYAWKPMLVNTWSINPEDIEQAEIQQQVVVEFIKNAVLSSI